VEKAVSAKEEEGSTLLLREICTLMVPVLDSFPGSFFDGTRSALFPHILIFDKPVIT
jgi:hypothetical protein